MIHSMISLPCRLGQAIEGGAVHTFFKKSNKALLKASGCSTLDK
jgi:hypothetical protein